MNAFQSVLNVFTGVTGWLVESFSSVMPLFYDAESGLTFVGVLSVVGLAIGISFLLVNTVRDWLRLR